MLGDDDRLASFRMAIWAVIRARRTRLLRNGAACSEGSAHSTPSWQADQVHSEQISTGTFISLHVSATLERYE